MSETTNEAVLESYEVVRQRVKDLAVYIEKSLPEWFTEADGDKPVLVEEKFLLTLLAELEEEFSYSIQHSQSMIELLVSRTVWVVEPLIDSACNKLRVMDDDSDVDLGFDLDEEVILNAEILWGTLLPTLPGSLDHLSKLAAQVVIGLLNAKLTGDPSWSTLAANLADNLADVFQLFTGMIAFNLMIIYVRVIRQGRYPLLNVTPV